MDDNTLALHVFSGLPSEHRMLRKVLENNDVKMIMSEVTAEMIQVEQRNVPGVSSKPAGRLKSQAFTVAAPKKPFDKRSVVCYYCAKRGHMKRNCYKRKADESKGKKTPGGGGRDGGYGSGPQLGAALAYTAAAGQPVSKKLTEAQAGSLCGCATSKRPGPRPQETRASISRRREAGPRSPRPMATKSQLRGTVTSLWTLARGAPRCARS